MTLEAPSLLQRLASHRAIGEAPPNEHEWLAAHGQLRVYAVGGIIAKKGTNVRTMMIVFTGHVVLRVDRGAGSHKVIEWRGGDVGGNLPYSRAASAPNDLIAEETSELFEISKDHFSELTRECPTVTATLVHIMLDRVRTFTSSDLRDEKLVSLGKLAAGLAHELNNPASAAMRAAKTLAEGQTAADEAARRLGAARLDAAQLAALDAVRDACRENDPGRILTGLERADREEALAEWLVAHGANESSAAPLAETAVTLATLDLLAASISGPALDDALRWLAAGCAARALTGAIETSASRISEIVHAVKGFTYMDQAPNAGPVDIRRGVADAITMLGAKIRGKNVDVLVDFAVDLPPVHAVGAELNQIWLNLLDNALDAVEPRGTVRVAARRELGQVVIEVIDNGAGIPSEILWRIFEPFYTTKGVGKGTGLGLDIVRRLVQRQEGGIDAESALGRTVFRVSLPVSDATGPVSPAPARRVSTMIGPHSD